MPGETDLSTLLRSLRPKLNPGEFVFCSVDDLNKIEINDVVSIIREPEGFTVVVEKKFADQFKLSYSFVSKWITLTVHSSLEAVGLTAAFSSALANENISCNVISGYYHDHIFLPVEKADKAIEVLMKLAAN